VSVVLLPDNARLDAIGPLPPSLDIRFIAPGAEPGPDHLAAQILVLAAELQPLIERLHDFTRLEVIQTLNAGVDWLLPRVPSSVTVCNASGAHDIPVAEWVVAVILARYHRLPTYLTAQQRGEWDMEGNALTTPPELIPGDDAHGKRVTILGHGSIGRAVARRLDPFGVSVLGVSRHGGPGLHVPAELANIASRTDVLVILCPLTDETRRMVDADVLARLPDGAMVVNGARGAVLDQDALEVELRAGRLFAALDVTDPEPLPSGHSLWTAPNLILTPHSAGSSRRWLERAYEFVGDQLRGVAAGEPLRNVREGY